MARAAALAGPGAVQPPLAGRTGQQLPESGHQKMA
jgi:hypothetical protein